MKEAFEPTQIEVVSFEACDIITSSNETSFAPLLDDEGDGE